MHKAIFMDRDGTISEEIGYMYRAGLYRPFPWAGSAVRKINESGMKFLLKDTRCSHMDVTLLPKRSHARRPRCLPRIGRASGRLPTIWFTRGAEPCAHVHGWRSPSVLHTRYSIGATPHGTERGVCAASSNNRVNLPVHPVTRLATDARRAPGRPAGYAGRYGYSPRSREVFLSVCSTMAWFVSSSLPRAVGSVGTSSDFSAVQLSAARRAVVKSSQCHARRTSDGVSRIEPRRKHGRPRGESVGTVPVEVPQGAFSNDALAEGADHRSRATSDDPSHGTARGHVASRAKQCKWRQ